MSHLLRFSPFYALRLPIDAQPTDGWQEADITRVNEDPYGGKPRGVYRIHRSRQQGLMVTIIVHRQDPTRVFADRWTIVRYATTLWEHKIFSSYLTPTDTRISGSLFHRDRCVAELQRVSDTEDALELL